MSPNTSAKKSREFFYLDGDINIRVENTVFRIDKSQLTRNSKHFESLLNPIIPSRDRDPLGSETNPVMIEDATSEEFACLLWALYNPDLSYKASYEKWKCILALARQWRFVKYEKLCIRKIGKMEIEPVEKIELYQHFGLDPNLLRSSFVELTLRPEPLSVEEGERLQIPTSIKIAQARERARDPNRAIKLEESNVQPFIEEVFGLQGSTPPSPTASPVKENTTTDDHVDKGGKGRGRGRGSRTSGSSKDIFGHI